MDYNKESLALHKAHKGKLEVVGKVPVKNRDDLSLAYTPGVAEPCRAIARDPDAVYDYTCKSTPTSISASTAKAQINRNQRPKRTRLLLLCMFIPPGIVFAARTPLCAFMDKMIFPRLRPWP